MTLTFNPLTVVKSYGESLRITEPDVQNTEFSPYLGQI
jgi:hypothetical protein